MRLILFSIALPLFLFSFDDTAILSKETNTILELKTKKNKEDSDKLKNSWLDPLFFTASYSKAGVDTPQESTTTSYRLNFSQDIFRSGGIYYAIKYADAAEKLQNTTLELEKKSLLLNAYQILFQIKKTDLAIKKQLLDIENAKLDIKKKEEQFLNGLLDISFLNNAIITRNKLENALAELNNSKDGLLKQFSNISDLNPYEIATIEFVPLDLEEFKNKNINLQQKKDEIDTKKYTKNLTTANYLPKITIDASYAIEDKESNFQMLSNNEPYYNYGIKLTMPLNFNTFKDIESSKLAYLISQSELETRTKEEENFYKTIEKNRESIKIKNTLARNDLKLYEKLFFQAKEQQQAGFITEDDVKIIQNSKESSKIDIEILKIDDSLELLKLYSKVAK